MAVFDELSKHSKRAGSVDGLSRFHVMFTRSWLDLSSHLQVAAAKADEDLQESCLCKSIRGILGTPTHGKSTSND